VYDNNEPTMLPIVLDTATHKKLKRPTVIKHPANGITASLGTGATMLSSIIKNATPG
jgi:hypothetical protein